MSISNRTTGNRDLRPRKLILRAFLAAALTCFAVPWFFSRLFIAAVLQPPCLSQAALPPPGYQSVTISTRDGLRLQGLWRPSRNGAVVLFMGGIGASSGALLQEAGWLADEGFGVLLVESRSCQGRSLTLGYREGGDFLSMADFARREAGVEWVGAFGFSSGAAAAIRAAAESQEIRALAAEGGYADLSAMLAPARGAFFTAEGGMQMMNLALFWRSLGFWPGLVHPVKDLEKVAPRPVLLVYGEKEPNRAQAGEMLSAAGENAVLWIAPGVGHGRYSDLDPEMHRRVLVEFFKRAYRETDE